MAVSTLKTIELFKYCYLYSRRYKQLVTTVKENRIVKTHLVEKKNEILNRYLRFADVLSTTCAQRRELRSYLYRLFFNRSNCTTRLQYLHFISSIRILF